MFSNKELESTAKSNLESSGSIKYEGGSKLVSKQRREEW